MRIAVNCVQKKWKKKLEFQNDVDKVKHLLRTSIVCVCFFSTVPFSVQPILIAYYVRKMPTLNMYSRRSTSPMTLFLFKFFDWPAIFCICSNVSIVWNPIGHFQHVFVRKWTQNKTRNPLCFTIYIRTPQRHHTYCIFAIFCTVLCDTTWHTVHGAKPL